MFELILVYDKRYRSKVIFFFYIGKARVSNSICWKVNHSLSCLYENQFSVYVWVNFWTLHSVLLISQSILKPESYLIIVCIIVRISFGGLPCEFQLQTPDSIFLLFFFKPSEGSFILWSLGMPCISLRDHPPVQQPGNFLQSLNGTVVELNLFVSRINLLHCLLSVVWKLLFHILCPVFFFNCSKWEGISWSLHYFVQKHKSVLIF